MKNNQPDVISYCITYNPEGLSPLTKAAAQATTKLANDGGCGGEIAPFYSISDAQRALDSVASREEQARMQMKIQQDKLYA